MYNLLWGFFISINIDILLNRDLLLFLTLLSLHYVRFSRSDVSYVYHILNVSYITNTLFFTIFSLLIVCAFNGFVL